MTLLVAREKELAVLHDRYAAMLRGEGSVLFLTGEAGLGKTTLVHEWWEQDKPAVAPKSKKENAAPLFIESACSIPIGGADVGLLEALQPWADILTHLHAAEKDGKKGLGIDLKKLITEAAPSLLSLIPIYGTAAWIVAESARGVHDAMSGGAQKSAASQQQIFQQYANLLTKISESRPLVVFLDDLHWADTSSCNLLFHISRSIANKKIFIIVTYRVEDAVAANDGRGHPILSVKNEIIRYGTGSEIPLTFLGRDAIRQLLVANFPEYKTDDRFELWLHKISEGNALFVSQFIKTLHEDGHINDKGAFTGDYATITIPATALAVVEERMRRLDDDTRELLSLATAEGEEFTSYVLGRLANKKPMEILRELKKAQKHGIIREKGTSRAYANQTTTIFGFSHALFHQALYNALNDEERNILHRECYELLRDIWVKFNDEKTKAQIAPKLLLHAEKSGEYVFGAEIALATARTFWDNYAGHEAVEMLKRVEAFAGNVRNSSPQEYNEKFLGEFIPSAFILRGWIDVHRAHYVEAHEWFMKAETIAAAAGNVQLNNDALIGKTSILERKREYNVILESVDSIMQNSLEAGYKYGVLRATNLKGIAATETGNYPMALSCFEYILEISEKNNDYARLADTQIALGNVHQKTGDYLRSRESYRRAIALSEEHGLRIKLAVALMNDGNACSQLGLIDDAREDHNKSKMIYSTIGDVGNLILVNFNLANAHTNKYEYAAAEDLIRIALTSSMEIGAPGLEANAFIALGSIIYRTGEINDAIDQFERGFVIAQTLNDPYLCNFILTLIADCRLLMHQYPQAQENYETALHYIKSDNSNPNVLSEIYNGLSEVYFYQHKDFVRAQEYVKQSIEIAEKRGVHSELVSGWRISGAHARLQGEFEKASLHLERALELATEFNIKEIAAEIRGELGLLREAEGKRAEAITLMRQCAEECKKMLPRAYTQWKKELDRVEGADLPFSRA